MLQGLAHAGMEADLEVREAGWKGRGVFAKTDIEKGTYLCEYRMTRVYHPNKYVKEFELNGEGSYLLETSYKPKLMSTRQDVSTKLAGTLIIPPVEVTAATGGLYVCGESIE